MVWYGSVVGVDVLSAWRMVDRGLDSNDRRPVDRSWSVNPTMDCVDFGALSMTLGIVITFIVSLSLSFLSFVVSAL